MIITPGAKCPRTSVIVETLSVTVQMMIINKVEKSKETRSSMPTTTNSKKMTGIEFNLTEDILDKENTSYEDDLQYDDYPELDIEYSYDYSF